MVNFETEKNLIRKMFKEIDTVFENDGERIEDTIEAEGVNIIFGRSVPSGSRRGSEVFLVRVLAKPHVFRTELLGRPSFGPRINH